MSDSDSEHRVTFEYEATDDGSRKRPFAIVAAGQYGTVKRVKRFSEIGVVYEIYLIMDGGDPEEFLADLVTSGIFVLQMKVDDEVLFTHQQRNKTHRKKVPTIPTK